MYNEICFYGNVNNIVALNLKVYISFCSGQSLNVCSVISITQYAKRNIVLGWFIEIKPNSLFISYPDTRKQTGIFSKNLQRCSRGALNHFLLLLVYSHLIKWEDFCKWQNISESMKYSKGTPN